jgi:hypothetical protein
VSAESITSRLPVTCRIFNSFCRPPALYCFNHLFTVSLFTPGRFTTSVKLWLYPAFNQSRCLNLWSINYSSRADDKIIFNSSGVKSIFYWYSHPKSFVNFLLPPLDKGRVGVGSKIYDSCKDCYSLRT